MLPAIDQRIAAELSVQPQQVAAAVALLDEGSTVPFIARYRKEATGGLDDTQLRALEQRLAYLRELEERRGVILASIEEQGKLTPALRAQLEDADTKQRLEDLYLPYKPKRRTKAQIAREAGLAGPRATTALIAADEVAVPRFLDGGLTFPGIASLVGRAVERFGEGPVPGLEELIALDAEVRAWSAASGRDGREARA